MIGYPGVASLDILDNVVPYIGGEEEKMEWETSKILGELDISSSTGFNMPKIPVLRKLSAINEKDICSM
jgi:aspartate-semialdehyde dehydrogenase